MALRFLFVHQNFPGQFRWLAPALVRRGHEVVGLGRNSVDVREWRGVRLARYEVARGTTRGVHPWVADIETKTIRAEACFRAALRLSSEGFTPDAIIAHHGWGEAAFLKEVWPAARFGLYCEFYYRPRGYDFDFDPEFPWDDPAEACRLQMRNLSNLLHFEAADAGVSPTLWQAGTFPARFRERITVVHDGIDTRVARPQDDVRFSVDGRLTVSRDDEVITFVSRNLEPYRGYHVFMRALPGILARRPRARVLIVGADRVSYGPRPPDGESWAQRFADEAKSGMTPQAWGRVHFLGHLPYERYLQVLQVSSVHVYLTYPFVLSWSLLEAMSAGCAIVASDTAPVREVIDHDEQGRLVGFFDPGGLADQVCALVEDRRSRQRLGEAARRRVIEEFDLERVCLPRQIAWAEGLQGSDDGCEVPPR